MTVADQATRYLMTRAHARALDYDWLGRRPPQRWWERYGRYTSFEHQTIIVEADAGQWRLYVSGIPSQRTDAVRTGIRHVLMLTGATSQPDEAARVLAAAVLAPQTLGQVLDRHIDEELVGRCLNDPGNHWAEVGQRLAAVTAELQLAPPQPQPLTSGQVVWAGADSPQGPPGLLARGAALIAGQPDPGVAALLNLVQPGRLPTELGDTAAFLVQDSDQPWQPVPKADTGPDQSRPLTRLVLITLTVGLVAVGVLAYLGWRVVSGRW